VQVASSLRMRPHMSSDLTHNARETINATRPTFALAGAFDR
jgi:hypothetical protein